MIRKGFKKTIRTISLSLMISLSFCLVNAQNDTYPSWKHFSIDPIMPGSSWGTGGPVLGDYDHDGDLDVALSRRNTEEAYWYERINDSIWIPHVIGHSENLARTLGTVALDIDHDGWLDVMYEGVWFRNPGVLDRYPDVPWKVYNIKAGGHDAVCADVDGNGVLDMIIYDGRKLSWYNTSDQLNEVVVASGFDDHGGVAPHGYGDLDGDSDLDLMIPGFWFENPGDLTGNWKQHEWPFQEIQGASYGRSIRSWIVDLNKDGKNDIVYSHCDTGGSGVFWIENKNKGEKWVEHKLDNPPTADGDVPGTGSFHSLGVADFNLDGNLDIFAGEQEDPDTYMESSGKVAMKPRGLKERGVIWYNLGGENPSFEIYVIHIDNPGWHDAQVGDVDGDGDIDIVSKIWNKDGTTYHADYWRNELKK